MRLDPLEKILGEFEGELGTQDPSGVMNYTPCEIRLKKTDQRYDKEEDCDVIEITLETIDPLMKQHEMTITIPESFDGFSELFDE